MDEFKMFGFSGLNYNYVPQSRKAISIATIAILTLSMLVPMLTTTMTTTTATTTSTSSTTAQATESFEILGEEVPVAAAPVQTDFASDGHNSLAPTNLKPGDIILTGTDDTIFDWLIPGKWSHTLIFGGVTTAYGQVWGAEEGTWLNAGEAWVIHSTSGGSAEASGRPSWDDDSGLRTSRWSTVCNAHADNILVLRILKPGGVVLTTAEQNSLLSFCTSKLFSSNGYDFNWLAKQTGIDTGTEPWLPPWAPDGYYCSELAWAMAMSVLGIDLDGDFSPLDVGVSPEDLYWAEHTTMVACSMNSGANGEGVPVTADGDYQIVASNDLYRIDAWIYQVRYDDDYDPWPKGDGEMYLKAYIGDGYFPSCAETHQTSDTNWDKIDDAGENWKSGVGNGDTVTWNGHHYSVVPYNSYVKIRFQAMEEDSWPDGDDSYPAFQWWWSPSGWHPYINGGWYSNGGLVDYGPCRYYVLFSISSCY